MLHSLIFLAEYLYRIATAENRRGYISCFYGIIDLVALLPILIHAAASLRVLRTLRLLKVRRYTNALDRYNQALKSIAAEATLFGSVAMSSSPALLS